MNPLEPVIKQLKRLPGIGEKSAQRLAFFLLSLSETDVSKISSSMIDAKKTIQYCKSCFNISLSDQCYICNNDSRDKEMICIVKNVL